MKRILLNDKRINYPIDMFKLFLLCFSLTLWTCVTCYPTGAPLNGYGCHGHVRHNREGSLTDIYPPQYTKSPYKILVNTTHVHKGDIVEGNIFVRSLISVNVDFRNLTKSGDFFVRH